MEHSLCSEWVARDEKVIAPSSHLSYYPLVVERTDGSIVTDIDGNDFIDFVTAASSLNIGGRQSDVVKAIREQLDKSTQFSPVYYYNRPMIEYGERLVSKFPGGGDAKIAFSNCGSDANDGAIKYARKFTGRKKIITFENDYHGSTYGSATMTTCTGSVNDDIGPMMPEIYVFPFFSNEVPDDVCEKECTAKIEEAFKTYMPPEETAAVIMEAVQGDAGMIPAHPIFMRKLYEMCHKHGILLISEEVQQGCYRTGPFFSIENYPGIIPDGVIMGKSLGAGLAAGAFIARAEIMDSLPAPAHIFTLAGNAITMAAGCAQFDVMEEPGFQKHLNEEIERFRPRCDRLLEKYPEVVMHSRGVGLSAGIGIGRENADGKLEASGEDAYKVVFRCYEKGLLIMTLAGSVLRLQPALNMPFDLLDKGFDIIESAIEDLIRGNIPDEVLKYKKGW